MYKEFAEIRRSGRIVEEEVSVNIGSSDVTGALLQGDSNEEQRMAERVAEKRQNAIEGKMKRVTADDIRVSQKSPKVEDG